MKLNVADSKGNLLKYGDIIIFKVEINHDVHGLWSAYEILNKNGFPVLSYLCSEKGCKLPKGYLWAFLSDYYDDKMLFISRDAVSAIKGEFIKANELQKQEIEKHLKESKYQ